MKKKDEGDAAIERIISWQTMLEEVAERNEREIYERMNDKAKRAYDNDAAGDPPQPAP